MNQLATVQSLRHRITAMQGVQLDDRALPTPAPLRALLPYGALRRGSVIAVEGSLQLALALLSAASLSGAWCGAVGVPELGAEALAGLGVALERFVVVPDAGAHALTVAGTLSEVLTVLVLQLAQAPQSADAARLAARLRERGTALITLGAWPGAESRLRVRETRWEGLERGYGRLAQQQLLVQSEDRRGTREHRVRFREGVPVAC